MNKKLAKVTLHFDDGSTVDIETGKADVLVGMKSIDDQTAKLNLETVFAATLETRQAICEQMID